LPTKPPVPDHRPAKVMGRVLTKAKEGAEKEVRTPPHALTLKSIFQLAYGDQPLQHVLISNGGFRTTMIKI